jgi:endonuclease III
MAVSVLRRDFGLPIRAGGEIAVDNNVRRVFRRTGLIERVGKDEDIRTVARRIHPADPSALDLGSWTVGADWCRPRNPQCHSCQLTARCPRVGVPYT